FSRRMYSSKQKRTVLYFIYRPCPAIVQDTSPQRCQYFSMPILCRSVQSHLTGHLSLRYFPASGAILSSREWVRSTVFEQATTPALSVPVLLPCRWRSFSLGLPASGWLCGSLQ